MENASLNYQELGFKCGLEIHQQLEGRKLFCNCPAINVEGAPDYEIKRHLRGVAGETGEIDIAAKFETEKGKYFIYEGHSANTCLVELDETPPYSINKSALETALKTALLLNADIVNEMQIMRKIVVDGSNASGFQRTALVAMDGFIESSLGKVRIPTICLEEEAAQKLKEGRDFVKYNLDRLGIPLIEIATSSDIKSPEHSKEVAGYIGMVLRSVEGVKRGLGTIRQDVNISINRGARTEIKGFQDLKSIPNIIEYEVKRQLEAIGQGKKLQREVRKAEPDFTTSFLRPLPGSARLYPETDILPVKIEKNYIEKLKSSLPKLLIYRINEFKKKYKLPEDLAKEILNNEHFENFSAQFKNIEPLFIAVTLIITPKEIKKRYALDSSNLTEKDFEEVFSYLNENKITKEAVIDILIERLMGEKIDISKYVGISDKEIEGEIKKIVKEKPNLSISAYMGLIMAKYRGKIEGKRIMEILKKNL